MKRNVDILVLSDLHLGTFGCKARELNRYLSSVEPEMVILNGDIFDMWNFKKRYFPETHMRIVKQIIRFSEKVPVYYITGNHDEALRRYAEFSIGNLHLVNQLELRIEGKKYWFFHGDIFDASMQYAKWLAKLGGWGYDLLIATNNIVNAVLQLFGRPRMSFSKRIKNSVKKAVKYISDFETTAAEIAIENDFDFVVCGHIHQPQRRTIELDGKAVNYMNSGDWIENLSALEFVDGEWNLYAYESEEFAEQEIIDRWSSLLKRVPA
ncbi:UDP-2,3-diacylglucosamine diphosphatase [Sanyastnella coralliicola]|uniref:UDP-2,3-diacylglucosamine diphosphatase n=1 Tax=Sanyastnella coralliicola TaxID=3069118 RepID=UPI0027B8D23B|nr:UDP-2,3-diacylglucosamine diphosphatase [Longitalea sp. SCSIO 12813]